MLRSHSGLRTSGPSAPPFADACCSPASGAHSAWPLAAACGGDLWSSEVSRSSFATQFARARLQACALHGPPGCLGMLRQEAFDIFCVVLSRRGARVTLLDYAYLLEAFAGTVPGEGAVLLPADRRGTPAGPLQARPLHGSAAHGTAPLRVLPPMVRRRF
ncbi:unnamed protein product [Prorocentrum cordatum]|uniref:Uncharacterized protein n=1 Tax=Prorocentrum cordatum TaxID=2364126 RepID=A0ABN9PDF6_9DINO|nr:unnamed protein product [Polarella glacialis]